MADSDETPNNGPRPKIGVCVAVPVWVQAYARVLAEVRNDQPRQPTTAPTLFEQLESSAWPSPAYDRLFRIVKHGMTTRPTTPWSTYEAWSNEIADPRFPERIDWQGALLAEDGSVLVVAGEE